MKMWQKCGGVVAVTLAGLGTSQAEPIQPKAVMDDPAWVLHVDVDALRPTAIGKYILAELDKPGQRDKLAMFENIFSFDPRKALHGVTLYGPTTTPEDAVALVYADFDPEHLTQMAEVAQDHQSTAHGKQTIHSWIDAKKAGKGGQPARIYAAIHGGRVVLFGQKEERLEEALDVLDGLKPSLRVGALLPRAGAGESAAVVQGAARKFDVKIPPPVAAFLKQVKQFSLRLTEEQGNLVGSLALEAVDEGTGKQMANLARGLVALLSLQKEKPEAAKLAEGLSVMDDGARAVIKLSLPAQEVITAIKPRARARASRE